MLRTRLLLLILAASLVAPAQAQVSVSLLGDDAQLSRHVLELSMPDVNRGLRKAWRVVTFKKRNELLASSNRIYQEFDCAKGTVKDLIRVHFYGPQATGSILSIQDIKNDPPRPADDLDKKAIGLVCGDLSSFQ
ncbi:MAG: hypothetical protein EBQ76_05690 [Betaproteobacteria bacterium]|nr:hypothetical protein [Betaproteobacteria bacterium]NDF04007.1 hypothetical protein [Betaproteobacteria bacterium]